MLVVERLGTLRRVAVKLGRLVTEPRGPRIVVSRGRRACVDKGLGDYQSSVHPVMLQSAEIMKLLRGFPVPPLPYASPPSAHPLRPCKAVGQFGSLVVDGPSPEWPECSRAWARSRFSSRCRTRRRMSTGSTWPAACARPTPGSTRGPWTCTSAATGNGHCRLSAVYRSWIGDRAAGTGWLTMPL
jgi:hypothetical protein